MTIEQLKKTAAGLDLGIAMLKECNLRCAYCHPYGQSKIAYAENAKDNMTESETKQAISVAYEAGFKNFKLTGGEPTLLPWFGRIVEYIAAMDPDNKINIVTNGTNLSKVMDLLEAYKDAIALQVSLDSFNTANISNGLDKVLTVTLKSQLDELSNRKIKTRLNMVVTKINKDEVPAMIDIASELGFSIKLFNLFIQEDYIATNGSFNGSSTQLSDPKDFWKANYVDLGELIPYLAKAADTELKSTKDGIYGSAKEFRIKGIDVLLLDSMRGHFYNIEECVKKCSRFCKPSDRGMYNPMISSNMVLHIDDCYNPMLRWNLRGASHNSQLLSFETVLKIFSNLHFIAGKVNPNTLNFVPDEFEPPVLDTSIDAYGE